MYNGGILLIMSIKKSNLKIRAAYFVIKDVYFDIVNFLLRAKNYNMAVENMRVTRSSNNLNLTIPIRRNEYGKNCLSFMGANIWNGMTLSNIGLNENTLRISKLEGKIPMITN